MGANEYATLGVNEFVVNGFRSRLILSRSAWVASSLLMRVSARVSLTRGVAHLLSRDRLTQGVRVRREPAGLVIDLYVVVEFGLNLAEVAANLRSRVKYQVEKLTELEVATLQIHIQGVKRTA